MLACSQADTLLAAGKHGEARRLGDDMRQARLPGRGCAHLQVRCKLQLVNALKDLAQEGLHTQWVLGLAQNLQELVIGQEVEAREGQPLGLQVVIQSLLDLQWGRNPHSA